jgi:hypothetical protein
LLVKENIKRKPKLLIKRKWIKVNELKKIRRFLHKVVILVTYNIITNIT